MPCVRIVADYCCPGYRLLDAEGLAAGGLPVPDDLLDRLAAWSGRFERDCDPRAYEDVSGKSFDFVAFAAEGLDLARAVKRALPGWTVFYWDESLDWFWARDPRHHDRHRCDYEITLADATRPR